MTSIRNRLLVWLLSALAVAGAVAGVATYFSAREELNEMLDYELKQIAYSLQRQPSLAAASTTAVEGNDHEDADFVGQIWNGQRTLVYSSHPGYSLPRFKEKGLSTVVWKNERWRVFSLGSHNRTIQVAQPLSVREETAAVFAMRILIPVLALIPLLAILIWTGVGRGLRPLRGITLELGRRNSASMEPVSVDSMPTEIKPMVAALNDLLKRLAHALKAQRRFIADAAHELRTPLTAVSLQAQIVERAGDPVEQHEAMQQLERGIERAVHLVQQLLTMARLDPEAPQRRFNRVELDDLAKRVLTEHSPLAETKEIDLGLVRAEQVGVLGDADSLRVMLGNLIDNAVRYTPVGGKVDVSIRTDGGNTLVEVQDTGCGIPPEERGRVFDRFYRRLGNAVPGSGLGLAIAKNIAEHHHAQITLHAGHNGIGLKVTVRFPRPG